MGSCRYVSIHPQRHDQERASELLHGLQCPIEGLQVFLVAAAWRQRDVVGGPLAVAGTVLLEGPVKYGYARAGSR
jgi:hypothetical protein